MKARAAVAWPARITRDLRWLLALAVTAYVLYITRIWRFPNSTGVSFPGLWAVLTLASAVAWRLARGGFGPVQYLATVAGWGMVLGDITQFWTQAFRDLHIYVKAGGHFLAAQPVYMTGILSQRPDDLSNYPYLYPPLTLPFVAALAELPGVVVDWGWLAASLAIALWCLRRFGLSWPWALAALIWPPFLQGLYVGNVAVPLLALFAMAPLARRGAGLAVAPVFKVYSGVATLWLVRERRWPDLLLGVAIVAFVALITLPIVGIGSWADWLNGLKVYRESELALPTYLYGFGLPRYVPEAVWLAVAFVVVALGLRAGGREGLARLGLATVVASPSLFAHGFLVAIPAFLRLRSVWLWATLGITSVAPDVGWWAAVAAILVSWFVPALRRDPATEADVLHPLGSVTEPWPDIQEPKTDWEPKSWPAAERDVPATPASVPSTQPQAAPASAEELAGPLERSPGTAPVPDG